VLFYTSTEVISVSSIRQSLIALLRLSRQMMIFTLNAYRDTECAT
jgi:hypothetical protein